MTITIAILLSCMLFCMTGHAQNLAKMTEKQRTDHLLKTAKATVMKYGPGY